MKITELHCHQANPEGELVMVFLPGQDSEERVAEFMRLHEEDHGPHVPSDYSWHSQEL